MGLFSQSLAGQEVISAGPGSGHLFQRQFKRPLAPAYCGTSDDIRAYFDSQVKQITADKVVLTTASGAIDLPNDYVIVQAGGVPPYDMLKSFGIAFGGEAVSVAQQDQRLQLVAS